MCGIRRALCKNAHLTGRHSTDASRRLTPVLYSTPHFDCKKICGFRQTIRDKAGRNPGLTGRSPQLRRTYFGAMCVYSGAVRGIRLALHSTGLCVEPIGALPLPDPPFCL